MPSVLITGGSRGIGAEMVRRFSREGYRVSFIYQKSHEAAKMLADETGAFPICADLGNEQDTLRAAEEVKEVLGGSPHVFISNAAVSGFSLFTDISFSEWNRFMAVNLNAAFLLTKAFLPAMITNKSGRILYISSMWGQVGASCEVHYSVTKAGLIGLTRSLAKEVGPSGITVNCIAPGVIETDMNASLSDENIRALCEETPLGRIGRTSDIAEMAFFLAGRGGDFITGQVFGVNGGFVI